MTLHQSGDVGVVGAAQQIALPVTWNGPVFNLCRHFPEEDGIDDLSTVISAMTRMPRAADLSFRSQVLNELFFQRRLCVGIARPSKGRLPGVVEAGSIWKHANTSSNVAR
jgi:hypothetical protein